MKSIFLFPHIPKTGGAAFLQNAERSFSRSKCLRVNDTYRQCYVHPRTRELRFYEKEGDCEQLLLSLTPSEKSEIKFASGHDLPYGFHKHFPQPAKYLMWIREPIARTISLYNYQRFQRDFLQRMKEMDESHRRLYDFSDRWFLMDGKVPSFEEWLERSYDQAYPFYQTMTHCLQRYGYLEETLGEDAWGRLFEKFFFVGITETMNEEELYLYHKMGIDCFWASRNASHSYVSYSRLDRRIQERIREKNQADFELYKRAKEVNARFKKKQADFPQVVHRMRRLKQKAWLRERMVPVLKKYLRPVLGPVRQGLRRYFAKETFDYERFAPEIKDINTALEHYRRYTIASSFVENKVVLDLATGVGYGAFMLAARAKRVVGIDCCAETIAQAQIKFPKDNLSFRVGSMVDFSLPEKGGFDVIVSFEALEHIGDHETCFKEMKAYLKPGGLLLLSTPNRPVYSDYGRNKNPFHVKEVDFEELKALFQSHFKYVKFYGQQTIQFSHVYPLDETPNRWMDFSMRDPHPRYFFCLASDEPIDDTAGSFYRPNPCFPDYRVLA